MNKTVVGVFVAIVVLASIGVAAMNMNKKDDSSNNTTSQTTETQAETQNQTHASEQNTQNQTESTSDVTIKNSAYSPAKITVKVGSKVTWTNQDSMQHNVAPDEDYGDEFRGSELLNRGETYSFTFNQPGTYTYHCTPHPFMHGTVVVTE
jgi:amicyanin